VALNGVILVSPYMDCIAGNAGNKNDLPYINCFGTFAATACYHKAIADQPESFQDFRAEADRFARGGARSKSALRLSRKSRIPC
jgi:hypothetical protein